jgi:FKBP-type peptidyl-prolyl cis-trans isomerase FkpA
LIKGWQEGIQLMNAGSRFKFYIPSELAYGDKPAGKIPPYSVIVFEVELLSIEN